MQDEERVKMIMEFAMRLLEGRTSRMEAKRAVEIAADVVAQAEKVARLGGAYGLGATEYVKQCGPQAAERFARELATAAHAARQVNPQHPAGGENGLYSKFRVRRSDGTAETRNSFVLIPFNEDGSVRDKAAVEALKTYAREVTNNPEEGRPADLGHQIFDWMQNPHYVKNLNVPEEVKE